MKIPDGPDACVRPVDVDEFRRVLGILRRDPDAVAADHLRVRQPRPRQPVFAFRRVLKMTISVIVIGGLLLVCSTLLTSHQPPRTFLFLVAGLLVAIVVLVLSRWRARGFRVTASARADVAAAPMSAGPGEGPPSLDGFQPSDDIFPLRPQASRAGTAPASRLKRYLVFAGSLSVYGAIAAALLPDLTTTWIVLTVFLHEAGHFAAKYLLGYSGLWMVFIPFIGGAVAGRKEDASPSDQLVTLLAGPAPGLLIGCLIYWLDSLQPLPSARAPAIWLIALNLLNLLPIWPLDGGRICWILFSRHSAIAQTVLSACSIVGACFLFLAPEGGTVFLIVMALLLVAWAPARYRHARAALAFFKLFPAAPDELEQLSERQLFMLYQLAKATESGAGGSRILEMTAIHGRVSRLPRSSPRFRFLLAYVLLWLVALVTAAGTALQDDARRHSVALGTLFGSVKPR